MNSGGAGVQHTQQNQQPLLSHITGKYDINYLTSSAAKSSAESVSMYVPRKRIKSTTLCIPQRPGLGKGLERMKALAPIRVRSGR